MRAGPGGRGVALALWAVWGLCVAGTLGFATAFASPWPRWDEWDFVPVYARAIPASAGWLWAQHYEYRMPLEKLILLLGGGLTGFDFRVPALLSAAGLAAVAGLFLSAARRVRGRAAVVDAVIPLLLLHPGHHQVLLENDYLTYVLSLLALAALARAMAGDPARVPGDARVAAAALALLPLTGAVGEALAPPLLAWTLLRARGAAPACRRLLLAGVAVGAGMSLAYLAGYRSPPGEPALPTVAEAGACLLRVLATGFGPAGVAGWPLTGLAGAALLVAGTRRDGEAGRAAGDLAWLPLAGFVLLGAIAVGRAGHGADAGTANRYGPLAATTLVLAHLALVRTGARWSAALLGLALLAYPLNVSAGVAVGVERAAVDRQLADDLEARLTPHELARRWWPVLYYSEPLLSRRMELLARARLGPFRRR